VRAIRLALLVLVSVGYCVTGIETVQLPDQQSKTLSGIVTDPIGATIANVRIVEVSPDWKTEIRSTITDAYGRWSRKLTPGKKLYYIRLVGPVGFDQPGFA
jgi:hypothetical protein